MTLNTTKEIGDVASEEEAQDFAEQLALNIKQALQSVKANARFNPEKAAAGSGTLEKESIKGVVDFKLSADSNYGTGTFMMAYDGVNFSFRDSYGTLIQTYPLDPRILKAAGELSVSGGINVEVAAALELFMLMIKRMDPC